MQIDIDFEVFKALTVLRESEGDSYNAVLRRLLKLSNQNALTGSVEEWVRQAISDPTGDRPNALSRGAPKTSPLNALLGGGAWFDNVFFPDGTLFKATYKGQLFSACIQDGRWIGSDGVARSSPSAAASAISHTNVNGWRFWHAQLPGSPEWRRMDEFKS